MKKNHVHKYLMYALTQYWLAVPTFGFCQRKHLPFQSIFLAQKLLAYYHFLGIFLAQKYLHFYHSQANVLKKNLVHKYLIYAPSPLGGHQPQPTSSDSCFMHHVLLAQRTQVTPLIALKYPSSGEQITANKYQQLIDSNHL